MEQGFYCHLDSLTKSKIINRICDLIYDKKLKVACYWGERIGGLPDYFNTDTHLQSCFQRNDHNSVSLTKFKSEYGKYE